LLYHDQIISYFLVTGTVRELELLQEVFSHRSDMSECSNKI